VNSQYLKSLIRLRDGTQAILAEAMGISLSRLNAKINETNGAEFSQRELAFIRDRYHLTNKQIVDIFFKEKVS
jgi:hypothetical protein